MKRKSLMIALLVIVCVIGSVIKNEAAQKIIGISSYGPAPAYFPTSGSILCAGSAVITTCPQFAYPYWTDSTGTVLYGITNNANPPVCLKTTDGGSNWNACSAQPFVAAVLNNGGYMTVASDGSVLFASGQGVDTCIIRRSTDGAVTWSTVFTDGTRNCSMTFAAPTPPSFVCNSGSAYCVFVDATNVANVTVIYSNDYGATWTAGTTFAFSSADSRVYGPTLTPDSNTIGVMTRGLNSSGAGDPFGNKSGSDFVATSNYVPAATQMCRPYIKGTSLRAICNPQVGGLTYRYVNAQSATELRTFGMSDSDFNSETLAVNYDDTHGYLVTASSASSTGINMFITTDDFVSVISLGQLTHAFRVSPCCRGSAFKWGTKVYFTSGASGQFAFFGVIQ